MFKRTEKFIDDLKLINDKCFPVESKLGGPYIKIFVNSDDEHRKLTKFLKENNLDYFVITPRSSRPIKVVIRGFPNNIPTQTIKEALEIDCNFKIEKVAQLTRFRTKEPLPLFQVTLPNIDINKSIWNLNSLLYLRVKIEKFVRKTGSIQCFNCNYWHHSAASCHMKPRCIKCGGEHHKDQCTTPPEKPVCINCGKEHYASYRGCEKFPKPQRFTKRLTKNSYVNPNISYAKVANNEPFQAELPPPGKMTPEDTENNVHARVYFPKDNVSELEDIKYVINEFRALFNGCDISSIARQLRNANNHIDKLSILIKFMPIFSEANTV
ncbi:Nucleic-acid-binding protein transposon like protein [Argiope bruennichi]|uniref:Nucleic-acid-binding protein transposon like protein n=1 Tax=Argiope bruennichi TaxID=94029 RepID=A0A8T0ELR6_ARGBR|nr:Nucleic-acid-binding protein transposon like protein [Argiope bruennichi]